MIYAMNCFFVCLFVCFSLKHYIGVERGWDHGPDRPRVEHIFPSGLSGKESAWNVGGLGWEDPVEKGKATHSSILA